MASSTVTIATRTGYSSNVRCLLSLRPMSRLGVWERVRVLNVQNGTRVTCFERNNHEHRFRGIGPRSAVPLFPYWEKCGTECGTNL